jgi:hypothetical protein
LATSPLHRICDLQMLAMRAGHGAWRFKERDDERCARDELVEEIAQHLIAAQFRELAMEVA